MSISGISDEGNNQNIMNTINSINALNGINSLPTTPGSIKQLPLQHNNSMLQNVGDESSNKPVIERGASWSFNETRILLSLWGQDMVQRQLTNSKRTRHVWEKIAEKIKEHGFERTPEQVRTRVFNMIAEYRRILKNPTPERKKKCIFFDALHKIYQAKDANGVRQALNNYEEEYNLEPIDFGTMEDHNDGNYEQDNSSENDDKSEQFSYAFSPSHFNANMNGMTNDHGSSDGVEDNEMSNQAAPTFKRMRTENQSSNNLNNLSNLNNLTNNSINFNNQSQNAFDLTSENASTILIDRMFLHLSKETEVMREWVVLERERLRQEISRKKEENDREERREKQFLSTLMKMQEQMFNFLSRSQLVKDVNTMNLNNLTNGQISNREHSLNGLNDHNDYEDEMN